ncbi:MAG: DUF1232 domain-containing protein [Bacteroidota bacterium]
MSTPPPPPSPSVPTRYRRAFETARRAAQVALERRTRLFRVVNEAYDKLDRKGSATSKMGHDVRLLGRLVRASARRQYRQVPWRTLVYAVAGLIYFIAPLDAIPDALLVLGFVDDIAVVSAVVKALREDLQAFERWEASWAVEAGPAQTALPVSAPAPMDA